MEQPLKTDVKTEETKTAPAGYRVESVLLLESSFTRSKDIDVTNMPDVSGEQDIKSVPHETTPDNKFAVTLELRYKGIQKENQLFMADIKMIGVFEKYGEPPYTEDKFKSINAPAIIYPFIREHLYNLCLRAGIGNVLLPTVNFKP